MPSEAWRVDWLEGLENGALVGPTGRHLLSLPTELSRALGRAWQGHAVEPAVVDALEEALRAEAARLFPTPPEGVDLELSDALVAALPWEAAFPPGVPVVRRVPGARAPALPFAPPLRVAVSPAATLPDAILTAVFGGGDYAPVLRLGAWGPPPPPPADVVQLGAAELPALREFDRFVASLAAAGARLLVVEAYVPADRAVARRITWALVRAGLCAALVVEDPGVLPELWADLVHARPLAERLSAPDWTYGRLTAAPGGERPVPLDLGAWQPVPVDRPPTVRPVPRSGVVGVDPPARAWADPSPTRGGTLHAAAVAPEVEGPVPIPTVAEPPAPADLPDHDPPLSREEYVRRRRRRRVVNVWLDGSPRLPLAVEAAYDLLVDVGPPRGVSTVLDPRALPPEVLDAARLGGTELDVIVTAAACELDGVAPDGPRWATVARRLVLDAAGVAAPLRVRVVPRFSGRGFVRVIVAWRNHVLQSLRVGLHTDPALPAGPVTTRVEYAAATDLGRLADLPSRRVALTLNRVEDVHAVSVLADDGTATRVASLTVRPAFFDQFVPAFRAAFEAAAVDATTGAYAFHPGDNSGDRARVERLLTLLATRGAYTFRTLFSREAADLLRERLAGADEVVQVAALAEGEGVPWSFVYDLDLVDAPDRVCLTAVDAAPPGDALLPWAACRASADCPLGKPGAERVVCPWGFWGVRHRVEQPPMRVEEAPTRDVVLAIPTAPVVRGVMGVSLALDQLAPHESEIASLPAEFVVVGKDPGFGPEQVRRALAEVPAALLYFYCHGGVDDGFGVARAWLSFGRTLDERVHPDELRHWRITLARHPLVIVNGCGTARIEPAQLAEFVTEFARHGAAGVVGTETRVWEPLAREVAVRLLADLLERRPLGEALQRVRHALLKKGNPLGLTYTAFASADLRLVPEG